MERNAVIIGVLICSTIVSAAAQVVFEEPGWCVWCPSVVALADGRYALVHSRWRESDGFEAWCAKSEAALAVSGIFGGQTPVGVVVLVWKVAVLAGYGFLKDFAARRGTRRGQTPTFSAFAITICDSKTD